MPEAHRRPVEGPESAPLESAPSRTVLSSTRPHVVVMGALLYIGVAIAITYPLIHHFDSAIVSHWNVDAVQSLWVQWWFGKAVASPDLDLWRTPMLFYPHGADLQLADINLAIAVAFYPIARVASPTIAYNLLLLASFVLSGLTMWWFVDRVTARTVGTSGGWAAGLLYAASPYWLSSTLNAWIYLVHVWIWPLAGIACLRAARTRRGIDVALLGLVAALAFHVSPQYLLMGVILYLLLFPWWLTRVREVLSHRSVRLGLIAGLGLAAVLVLPRAIPMFSAARGSLVVHHDPINVRLAARPAQFIMPGANGLYAGYSVVFVSITVPLLLALGLWRSDRRAAYVPWLVTAGALLILSFGPYVDLSMGPRMVRLILPERALLELPGFSQLTNHWRWTGCAWFALITACGLALADLRRGRPAWIAKSIAMIVVLGYLTELKTVFPFPVEMPLWSRQPTPISYALRDEPGVHSVHDLSRLPQLNQIAHQRPITSGWLPRIDSTTEAASRALSAEVAGAASLDAQAAILHRIGVDALILDSERAVLIEADPLDPDGFVLREIRAGAPTR